MMNSTGARIFTLFVICGVAVGCGPGGPTKISTVKAKGKVFLDDEPHGPAQLVLTPVKSADGDDRPTIGGVVNADGSFTLTTYDSGDGAPAGEYTATLSAGASGDSTDPAAMMAMMGGGPGAAPLQVSIPSEGSESLELRFTKSAQQSSGAGPGTPLGTSP